MTFKGSPVVWWALASAAAMALGAFGPWAKALGIAVGGTDGSNDGWIVVGAAVVGIAAVVAYAGRPRNLMAIWALVAGAVGAAVTIYDRQNLTDALDDNEFGALVQVGWGLNLALAASISLAIASLVLLSRVRSGALTLATRAPTTATLYRECPHCKEQMRRDATVCPHCRNETDAWTLHEGYWWRRAADGNWEYLDERTQTWAYSAASAKRDDAEQVPST